MSDPSSRSLEVATRILNFLDDAMAHDGITDVREIAHALDRARAEERERCARIADKFTEPRILAMWNRPGGPPGNAYVPLRGKHIAAAIRAEKIGESEERTTSPKDGAAEG